MYALTQIFQYKKSRPVDGAPLQDPTLSLSLRMWVYHPNTRIYVRLLGPCFKTGRLKPFRQHPKHRCGRTDRAPSAKLAVNKLSTNRHQEAARNPRLHCRPQSNPERPPKAIMSEDYLPLTCFLQVKLMLTRSKERTHLPKGKHGF